MAYTFIVLRTDRTDKGSKTFTLPKWFVWLFGVILFTSPAVSYFVTYNFVAPNYLVKEAKIYGEQAASLTKQVTDLVRENSDLELQAESLRIQAQEDRKARDEVEARMAITEQARITSSEQVLSMETQILEMERRLAFFEKFVTPETEEEVLQCFNISLKRKGSKLTYGVNFLKHDQKDRKRIDAKVRFKVLYGSDVLNLTEESTAAEREVKMSLTKDKRLTGSLKTNVSQEGLHILDIKAYDKDENVIAHCWKPF